MGQATPLEQTEDRTAQAEPATTAERIQILDILRGFALFGILLVNMAYFANPVQYVLGQHTHATSLDAAAEWLIRFVGEGKFYSLFSLLFGLGFTLMMARAQERGVRFVPLHLRRLLILLLFGLVHGLFIWVGDILVFYALLGVVLILFRNTGPKWLLRWSIIFLVLPFLFTLLGSLATELARMTPEGAALVEDMMAEQVALFQADIDRAYEVYATGNFIEITAQRWQDLQFMWLVSLFMAPSIMAMFLLGAYLGRRAVFRHVEEHLPLFRRLLIWGGIIGVIGNALYASFITVGHRMVPDWTVLIATTGQLVGAPALMLFYVAGVTLLARTATWGPRLALLAPVGRMALTNYLLQSIICTLIFYGYGLGFFGQIGAAAGILLTLVIYAAQIPFSHWWLSCFRFGPAEWLWRTLTYGRFQPLRLSSVPA
jgi:uncharacterized protein